MPANPALTDPPVTTIPEAVSRMKAIRDALPLRDGLNCFNLLYLEVTQSIENKIGTGFFDDDDFLNALDVAFANRYFDAVRADATGASPPKSWDALIERRQVRRIHPMQFVAAGMNAHINFDLALALVDTCRKTGDDVDDGTRRPDFDRVNDVFRELEPVLRQRFQPSFFGEVEEGFPDFGRAQDIVSHFSIIRARDQAWEEAEFMDDLSRRSAKFAAGLLDRLVGAFGNGLLVSFPL